MDKQGHHREKKITESARLFRFVIVGTLNYIITMLVIGVMTALLSFEGDYLVANITAYVIAQTHNFLWCRHWVFPSDTRKNSLWRQILLFCTAFAIAYSVQFLFLVLAVEACGADEYVAQFLGLVLYGAINFMANKKITFK